MAVSKRNPIKIMLIVAIVLMLAVVAIVLFKKDKVVMEDEQGNTYTGVSGKFVKYEEVEA